MLDQVRLGSSGLKVSRLALGCMGFGGPGWFPWVLDREASKPFFRAAIDKGFTFFDTANVYSNGQSEEVTGHWLKEFARRDEIVIATKLGGQTGPGANEKGLSRKAVLAAVDASLKRLGTDYIDLYQIHRFDYDTPIEETMEALHDVVKAGKARHIGGSSMYAWQFARMLAVSERHGWTRFATMQPQLNLVYREEEREMLPLCKAEGIGVVPWSPMAGGYLSGGDVQADPELRGRAELYWAKLYTGEADQAVLAAVSQVARARGVPNMQVALAWVLRNPAVSAPIVGVSRLEHLDDAIAATRLILTDEEAVALESPYRPKSVADHG